VAPSGPTVERALGPTEGIAAFARLYATVRWFHPADSAAGASWDSVAVDGMAVARSARTPEELRDGLLGVLSPVAPSVQVWVEGDPVPPPTVPAWDGPSLAWQHLGWSFGGDQAIYASARLGRGHLRVTSQSEVTATNGLGGDDAVVSLRGREVRVSARLRVESEGTGAGHLWVRVDGGPDDAVRSKVGWDTPALRDAAWGHHSVTTRVADDATWLVFGARMTGEGTLWADDFKVEVRDGGGWRAVPIRDGDLQDPVTWWNFDGWGYEAAVVEEQGDRVLRLAHTNTRPPALFASVPAPGEAYEAPLGAGLVARVPLTLPADPPGPAAPPYAPLDPERDDPDVRVAAVIVAWGALRNFWPYGSDVAVDWDAALADAVAGAVASQDRDDLVDVLWGLLGRVPDGHGWADHVGSARACGLPLRWVRVGDALVVTSTATSAVQVGDEVVTVDGAPVADALAGAERRVSGSAAFREAFAAERLAIGVCGAAMALTVARGAGTVRVSVPHEGGAPPLFAHPGVAWTEDGYVLVDLNTVPWADLEPELDELARARGIVFDLREYPAHGVSGRFVAHLLRAPDVATGWMRVPEIVRPGDIEGWQRHEWALTPREPHLGGDVVFLTSPLAISAAESLLLVAEANGVGVRVGQATAGTNGNATGARLPGGYVIQFTGMRVVDADGGAFHLRGLAPDVEVAPTLDGLRAGRDEVRDAALAWLRAR
jgi:C-terminal processing protease CtpA/Prc